MKLYKIFKITMMVLAGLTILFIGIYSIVMTFSHENFDYLENQDVSNVVRIVLDGDSDNTLNVEYDKLTLGEKTQVLEIVTKEMQKKIDEYKAGKVKGNFEEYVGDVWDAFEYIIRVSYDVEDKKIKEAEIVIYNMELIVDGQELISEAESCIKERDYIEAHRLIEIIEEIDEKAGGEGYPESIYEYLYNEDQERINTIKTAIKNEAGTYYISRCKQLADEAKYSEIEDIIEQVRDICLEEDIAVMQEYILTREKAFEKYLENPADYEVLLANGEYNYVDTVVNYYGYYDVDEDNLNELVFSNINGYTWESACYYYYLDFDEDKKNLEPAKHVEYKIMKKSGIEWIAFNDSVEWRNAYTDVLMKLGFEKDYCSYDLCDIDGNGIPELIISTATYDDSDGDIYSYVKGNLKQYNEYATQFGINSICNNNFITFGGNGGVPSDIWLNIATYKNEVFINAPTYIMGYVANADGKEYIQKQIIETSGEVQITEIALDDMNEELKSYGINITSQYMEEEVYPFYVYNLNYITTDVTELNGEYDARQQADILESVWSY